MPDRTSRTTAARSGCRIVPPGTVKFLVRESVLQKLALQRYDRRTKGTRPMQSWIHVIEWRAAVRRQVTALADDRGAEFSYAGLRAEVERRAGGWAGLGVRPEDIVAIVAKNSADFLVHAFALMRAGATPAFVNWRLSGRELAE